MQSTLAITGLTLKAAFRFRLFFVLAAALVAVVIGLPLLIKGDGTAQGLTQIIITYSLGSITVLMGFATLWLSCGTMARDIEECQMQIVAVKPIARWQIWLGKWLGILTINFLLLSLSGGIVYGLIKWRAQQLSPNQQEILRSEVMVGRGSLRPPVPDFSEAAENIYREQARLDERVREADPEFARRMILERLLAENQVIPSGHVKAWEFDLSHARDDVQAKILHLRIKFFASQQTPNNNYGLELHAGAPDGARIKRTQMTLAANSYHTIPIPPELLGADGMLRIEIWNRNPMDLLFTQDDGVELLYPEYGFHENFARGIAIIFLWLGLLSAIGLASASSLSFPVAAFLSLGILMVGLSSGTMSSVVETGRVIAVDPESTAVPVTTLVDSIFVFIFSGVLKVVQLVQGFSPVEDLSTGRSISWKELLAATFQIGIVMSGLFAAAGIFLFNRRELATAQTHQ